MHDICIYKNKKLSSRINGLESNKICKHMENISSKINGLEVTKCVSTLKSLKWTYIHTIGLGKPIMNKCTIACREKDILGTRFTWCKNHGFVR